MTEKRNFLAENITFLSARTGLSFITLADQTHIDPSTLYRLADPANNRQPRARTLRSIADFFHVDPFDLLERDLREDPPSDSSTKPRASLGESRAEPPTVRADLIPLVRFTDPNGFDPAIIPLFLDDFDNSSKALGFNVEKWIHKPYGIAGENLIAIEMSGDAMAPVIRHKDIVFISDFDRTVFEDKQNALHDGEYILAKVELLGRPAISVRKAVLNDFGEISLIPENGAFVSQGARLINTLGKVVGISRGFSF